MPWTPEQNKVWRAIEHGWKPPAGKFEDVTPEKAKKMAHEGVKASQAKNRGQVRAIKQMSGEEA